IGMSLPLGATVYFMVVWLAIGGPQGEPDPAIVSRMSYVFVALLGAMCVAALFLWRSRVEPLIHGGSDAHGTRAALQRSLVATWSLIEVVALAGCTFYLLFGMMWAGLTGVLLSWLVFLFTRPQQEWFERLSAQTVE